MTGVRMQGTIPFPPTADPVPIQRLASDLQRLSQGLQQGAQKLNSVASTASQSWAGQAAGAYTRHTSERARTVQTVASCTATAATGLNTLAAGVQTAIAAYDTAAMAEQAARAGLPWTAAALAAAIAAEGAALGALQVAGSAAAVAIGGVALEIAASQLLGIDRSTFDAYKQAASDIWENVSTFVEEGDIDSAIKLANTTITLPNGDGTSTRTSAVGWLMQSNDQVNTAWQALQGIVATGVLLTEPPLQAVERPDLVDDFRTAGFTERATSATQLGWNQDLVEGARRPTGIEADQSMVVVSTRGVDARTGAQVLSVTLPGIVSPDQPGALNGASGARNALNAAASQISGFGQEELALRNWVEAQGLQPGDTINLYGHSQGGIVARNLANDLITRGYDVNVVSFAPPDGPYRDGVQVFNFQNERDFVPALRVAGDGGATTTLYPNQFNIRIDEHSGTVLGNHESEFYGPAIDGLPAGSQPGLDEFRRWQQDQATHVQIDESRTGVTTFLGPRTPDGEPIDVSRPGDYDVPVRPWEHAGSN